MTLYIKKYLKINEKNEKKEKDQPPLGQNGGGHFFLFFQLFYF